MIKPAQLLWFLLASFIAIVSGIATILLFHFNSDAAAVTTFLYCGILVFIGLLWLTLFYALFNIPAPICRVLPLVLIGLFVLLSAIVASYGLDSVGFRAVASIVFVQTVFLTVFAANRKMIASTAHSFALAFIPVFIFCCLFTLLVVGTIQIDFAAESLY